MRVEQRLQFGSRLRASFSGPPNSSAISITLPCSEMGGTSRYREDELGRAVLGVLVQQLVQDLARLRAELVEEVLLLAAQALGPLAPGAQRAR